MVLNSLCVECGAIVERKKRRLFVPRGAPVANIEVSGDEANRLAKEARARRGGKLSLVLDLDHTLVECTVGSKKTEGVFEIKVQKKTHLVRLRPKLQEFFEGVSSLYESTIYTHGSREYAVAVAGLIESRSSARFGGRIVSRDDCPDLASKAEKRLDRAFPGLGGTDACFIVDDRHDVWVRDFDHLVLVRPYKFFGRSGGDADVQLVHALKALVDAHHAYFQGPPSAATALRTVRRRVFDGLALHFIGPEAERPLLERLATEFGATVADADAATHALIHETSRHSGGHPTPRSLPSHLTFVHLDWFWFSVWHLRREDPTHFFVPPNCVAPEEEPPPPLHKSATTFFHDDDGWADALVEEITSD